MAAGLQKSRALIMYYFDLKIYESEETIKIMIRYHF
jgi:hypothetical protein